MKKSSDENNSIIDKIKIQMQKRKAEKMKEIQEKRVEKVRKLKQEISKRIQDFKQIQEEFAYEKRKKHLAKIEQLLLSNALQSTKSSIFQKDICKVDSNKSGNITTKNGKEDQSGSYIKTKSKINDSLVSKSVCGHNLFERNLLTKFNEAKKSEMFVFFSMGFLKYRVLL